MKPYRTPSIFGAVYDLVVQRAVDRGVCPKVTNRGGGRIRGYKACSRPLAMGSRFCEKHRYGV